MKKLCRKSGKVKFRSHESAALTAGKVLEKDSSKSSLSTYLCPHCNHWHLTSRP